MALDRASRHHDHAQPQSWRVGERHAGRCRWQARFHPDAPDQVAHSPR
ncbi:DUF317 domain-containing protein [Devosia ginsengisoli]|uniref:DUF317 domain-containing protein n=1 Tax=Devosia ginsengisoli TaxID=400770 RepID=A0A5B8M0V9_9HYPH|nr:DUF317 domain-containing protein [Devosia ginsengisoli]